MATVARKEDKKVKKPKQHNFAWAGLDKNRRPVSGIMLATDEETAIRRIKVDFGASVQSIKKKRSIGKKIEQKDIAIFTRQMATMMRAGVPLLQSFDIVAKGAENPRITQLLMAIRDDISGGASMAKAYKKHPEHFNDLYCNLLEAGEQAGILESVLDRLAMYQEKTMALRSKIKSALMYPTMIIVASFVITAVIMIFVIPAFKSTFESFGAELPGPTQIVMNISDFMVANWYFIFGGIFATLFTLFKSHEKFENFRNVCDRISVRVPIFGSVIEKAIIARWCRTLSTMFAAGVPLVDCLGSVSGAAGNVIYRNATNKIQSQVSTGTSLTNAMNNANLFPVMVTQFTSIGEESGSIDAMLAKAADFYEREVDDAVDALASLMEPLIMIVLGVLVGGIVVAMYLPIFKLGAAM